MSRDWQHALKRGDFRRIRAMLSEGVDVNARDSHHQSALMRAAHAGHLPLLQVLLAHGAALDSTAKYGLSALMLAIIGGHEAIACRLIDAGADVGIRGRGAPGFFGRSARDLALARGLSRGIARLAHAEGDAAGEADVPTRSRDSPCDVLRVHDAFRNGDLPALRMALPDPRTIPNGRMPDAIGPCIVYAIHHSPPAFVRALLDLGAVLDGPYPDGFPPLIAALSGSRQQAGVPRMMEMLRLLLDAGANPDQRGINDHTPLHMAAGTGNLSAVLLLLETGADPRLRTRIDDYESPREIAAAAGHDDIVALLAHWGG